ncbi:MAG: bifunctional precorrin-2 dehydrogenase/sirohydrochlorin ferrochelatase [Raineya sp.]|jgi:hypothetical protein|nr:bifunctional precorrin-2 dehydrogenase/sirohydrochlorin ferrochelatase [Raineya sp.]
MEQATNTLFPVFLKTDKAKFLIVGGGNVGLEKAETLIRQNPSIDLTIIALEVYPKLKAFLKQHPQIKTEIRAFQESDLDNIDFVITATNDRTVNTEIKSLANQRNILVNAADQPELCDFYLGSIVKKGHLKIAISTNGKSPVLARRMREYLEEALPENLNESISALNEYRNTLKGDFNDKLQKLNRVTQTLKKDKSPRKKYPVTMIILLIGFIVGYILASFISIQQIHLFF